VVPVRLQNILGERWKSWEEIGSRKLEVSFDPPVLISIYHALSLDASNLWKNYQRPTAFSSECHFKSALQGLVIGLSK
jgi:hypothetical protein